MSIPYVLALLDAALRGNALPVWARNHLGDNEGRARRALLRRCVLRSIEFDGQHQ